LGRFIIVVIEDTNRKQKQELIAIVEIPIIADFHLLDLDIKKCHCFIFWSSFYTWRIRRKYKFKELIDKAFR